MSDISLGDEILIWVLLTFAGVVGLMLAASAVGVGLARRRLSRPGFWLRHGVAAALVAAILLAGSGDGVRIAGDLGALLIVIALVALSGLLAHWSARRLIDIGWSRWWALAAGVFFPIPTILFGLPLSAPAVDEGAAVDAFQ